MSSKYIQIYELAQKSLGMSSETRVKISFANKRWMTSLWSAMWDTIVHTKVVQHSLQG